mgnify:CR=1 FL=1
MIGAIVQARMSSIRFPGKVLYKVNGKPLLKYLIESLFQCSVIDQVVVATSIEQSDKPIVEFCQSIGVECYQGPLENVADRFAKLLEKYKFDAFVRICGDSPMLDYRLVSRAVSYFNNGEFDIVTNTLKRTFPKGQSIEIVNRDVFKTAYPLMKTRIEKEHVTKYFYLNVEKFNIYNFESGEDLGKVQLSVDTTKDMLKFKTILTSMERPHWQYTFKDILKRI